MQSRWNTWPQFPHVMLRPAWSGSPDVPCQWSALPQAHSARQLKCIEVTRRSHLWGLPGTLCWAHTCKQDPSMVLLLADGLVAFTCRRDASMLSENNMLQGAQIIAADGAGVGGDVPAPHGDRVPLLHVEHGLRLPLSAEVSLFQCLSGSRCENTTPSARGIVVAFCALTLCAVMHRSAGMPACPSVRMAAACGEATQTHKLLQGRGRGVSIH